MVSHYLLVLNWKLFYISHSDHTVFIIHWSSWVNLSTGHWLMYSDVICLLIVFMGSLKFKSNSIIRTSIIFFQKYPTVFFYETINCLHSLDVISKLFINSVSFILLNHKKQVTMNKMNYVHTSWNKLLLLLCSRKIYFNSGWYKFITYCTSNLW